MIGRRRRKTNELLAGLPITAGWKWELLRFQRCLPIDLLIFGIDDGLRGKWVSVFGSRWTWEEGTRWRWANGSMHILHK